MVPFRLHAQGAPIENEAVVGSSSIPALFATALPATLSFVRQRTISIVTLCAIRAPCGRLRGLSSSWWGVAEQGLRGEPVGLGVVVVAASLGGLRAIETIIGRLPYEFPLPIVLVQHLSERHPTYLVDLLARSTRLGVRWLRQGTR